MNIKLSQVKSGKSGAKYNSTICVGLEYKWVRIQMGTIQIGTTYVYVYVYICICIYMYIYMYICIYVNIHVYYDDGLWGC